MPKLVTAILARNEASRYLPKVLERCLNFSDKVLLLDDRSTDDTAKLASSMGCDVRGRSVLQAPAWGTEAPARAELWDWASEEAGDGWILVCDADMLFEGNPRELLWTTEANSWAFILYDLWNETQYRSDGYWQAHLTPRPWLLRPKDVLAGEKPVWNGRGIHVGHIPLNAQLRCLIAPVDTYYWLHYSYSTPADRLSKYQSYQQVAQQLTQFEREHSGSICDGDIRKSSDS